MPYEPRSEITNYEEVRRRMKMYVGNPKCEDGWSIVGRLSSEGLSWVVSISPLIAGAPLRSIKVACDGLAPRKANYVCAWDGRRFSTGFPRDLGLLFAARPDLAVEVYALLLRECPKDALQEASAADGQSDAIVAARRARNAELVRQHNAASRLARRRAIFDAASTDGHASRRALREYLVGTCKMTPKTAAQMLKPSAEGKLIAELLAAKVIEPHLDGWRAISESRRA
jgi:hypothetical protein